jgi:hypothetical protein
MGRDVDGTPTDKQKALERERLQQQPQPADLESVDWGSVDIPCYVRYRENKLTFPEKVSANSK